MSKGIEVVSVVGASAGALVASYSVDRAGGNGLSFVAGVAIGLAVSIILFHWRQLRALRAARTDGLRLLDEAMAYVKQRQAESEARTKGEAEN